MRITEDYKSFIKGELKKAGKSLGKMSDEETKAFFASVDKKWKAQNEGKADGAINELTKAQAMKQAKEITKKDRGIVQHVNKLSNGSYEVSDWYDYRETVASFVNGIRESINEGKEVPNCVPKKECTFSLNVGKSQLKEFNKLHGNVLSELRSVKVTYDSGDTITTSMAAHLTDKEIKDYFKVGKSFNIGDDPKDKMAKVKKVQILK